MARLPSAPRAAACRLAATRLSLAITLALLIAPAASGDAPGGRPDAAATPAAGEPADAPGATVAAAEPDEAPPPPVVRVGEVAVTATRAERGVLEIPGNVTVIDREAIERSGVRHVADLLRREAGLYVTNTTSTPSGYTVESRGFQNGGGNGSSLLVLVDGRRANEPESSTPDWALLRLDQIERIEVVRGPASAVWGDGAVGGVVQILTRRASGPPQVTWRQRAGTFDLDGGSLFGGGEHGPVGVSLFVEGERLDGFREQSRFKTRAADGTLRFTAGDRVAVEVGGGYSSDDRDLPGALTAGEIARLGRDAADPDSAGDIADARVRRGHGLVEVALSDAAALELRAHYRRRRTAARSSTQAFDFALDRETESEGAGLKLVLDGPFGGHRSRLTLGADYLHEKVDNESLFTSSLGASPSDDTGRRRVYGAYAQEELNLSEDLLLSAGLRYDHVRIRDKNRLFTDPVTFATRSKTFHSTFDLLSPRAALTWRAIEPLSLYASFARGFRFPNFDEAFGFFGFAPELRPERSTSYELGAKWRSERLSVNAALYHMDVDDEILFNSEVISDDPVVCFGFPPCPDPQNANFERVRHRGLELSASVRPVSWLELRGSYTYDDTEIRRDALADLDGNEIPITPHHRGSYGARLILPYGIEIGADAIVVGERRVANDLELAADPLGRYARYDAVVTLRPDLDGLAGIGEHAGVSLQLVAHNVTDREYTEFAGQSSFSPFEVGRFPAPGRHYEAALTVTLRR